MLTRTADISLSPDGIVLVRIKSGLVQSLEDAKDNLEAAIEARDGVRRPILIDIRVGEPLDPAARHHYSGPKLAEWFGALALVTSTSAFGVMMGNIYLRIARPGIPLKLFHTIEEAVAWLKSHPK